ncbi:MAG: hypothetical protein HZB67_03365 [Candidatus Aenigmarchaeota archaeon]|nr:hypothetical protein [Candidatus Aenigmarchaeota archaeon]
MKLRISDIKLRIIYNTLGKKAVEAVLNNKYSASSAAGTSVGTHEAKILPTEESIANFNRIKEQFIGSFTQEELDRKLKNNIDYLGANLTTALSLAFFSSRENIETFPNLLGNVLGGGAHSGAGKMNMQEILILPSATTVPKAMDINQRIWKEIGKTLPNAKQNIESAWSADITNEEALDMVSKIAEQYGARLGVDFAASHYFVEDKYVYHNRKLSKDQQIKYVLDLVKKYNLFYIEDPLEQNDFSGFSEITRRIGSKTLVCGDDLTTTNPQRLKTAIEKKSINSIIVKPNQIGTISESINIISMAKKKKIIPVVSHRSGETKDTSICKLAQLVPLAKLGAAGNRRIKLDALKNMWYSAKKPRMLKLKF